MSWILQPYRDKLKARLEEKITYEEFEREREKIKSRYKKLEIKIFDIKDLVEAFLLELKRCGKSKITFYKIDLYKILDY